MVNIDAKEMGKKMLKYIIEGLVVAVAAWVMPGKKSNPVDVLCLGLVAAATFSLLDLLDDKTEYTGGHNYGGAVRSGAGMGIGANLVGFPAK
jgi:hypothetical protein